MDDEEMMLEALFNKDKHLAELEAICEKQSKHISKQGARIAEMEAEITELKRASLRQGNTLRELRTERMTVWTNYYRIQVWYFAEQERAETAKAKVSELEVDIAVWQRGRDTWKQHTDCQVKLKETAEAENIKLRKALQNCKLLTLSHIKECPARWTIHKCTCGVAEHNEYIEAALAKGDEKC